MTVVIQFPLPTARPGARPVRSAKSALESYLEDLILASPASVTARRMAERARRISQVLRWHDLEVLTDVRHIPGARRQGSLWVELDACERPGARACERLMARAVKAHLAAHETGLMADCLGVEVDMLLDPTPTPA